MTASAASAPLSARARVNVNGAASPRSTSVRLVSRVWR
jgi:hypothetical protein